MNGMFEVLNENSDKCGPRYRIQSPDSVPTFD